MIGPRVPLDEASRLEALAELHILATPHEEPFDRVVRLAARGVDAPMAYLSFVDGTREWFKAGHEWTLGQLPREDALASYAILGTHPFVVEDLQHDPRFPGHPFAGEDLRVRAYAAYPVRGPTGGHVGVLAVLDHAPRVFRRQELEVLADLAHVVEDELALRVSAPGHAERERAAMRAALDTQDGAVAILDRTGVLRYCNDAWRRQASTGGLLDPMDRPGLDHVLRLSSAEGPLREECRAWARGLRDLLAAQQHRAETTWMRPDGIVVRATAERLRAGDQAWLLVQHEARPAEAGTIDGTTTGVAVAMHDVDSEAEIRRRARVLDDFRNEAAGIETPMRIQSALLKADRLGPLTPRQRSAVDIILRSLTRWREAGDRMQRRLQEGDAGDADASLVLGAALKDARNRALVAGVQVHAVLPAHAAGAAAPPGLQVPLRPDTMRRMVDAILDRALRETPSGATVLVHLHHEAGHVVVEVQDAGPALMEPDHLLRPTGPEGPPHPALLWMRVAAEAAGGTAWAEPAQPGVGVSVGFRLPLGRPDPVAFPPHAPGA